MTEIRKRYWVYGLLLIVGSAAYAFLDEEGGGTDGIPADRERGQATLPSLHALSAGGQSTVKRDLFVLPAPPVTTPVVVEETKTAPELPPVDRLAEIQVLGVVSQRGQQAVLVRYGNETLMVAGGRRFGKGDALEIDMIDAGQIRVLDLIANVSKTFTLSEE